MGELSVKQQKFVSVYLETFNATESARRAKYRGNDATLAAIGYENLRKPQIAETIKIRLAETAMVPDEVLARLAEQARAAYADFLTDDGVDMAALLAAGKGHLVKKVKSTRTVKTARAKAADTADTTDDEPDGVVTRETVEIEFYDAQAALFTVAKIHGLLRERTEVSGPNGGPVRTEDVTKPDLSRLTTEELRTWLALTEKAKADGVAGR